MQKPGIMRSKRPAPSRFIRVLRIPYALPIRPFFLSRESREVLRLPAFCMSANSSGRPHQALLTVLEHAYWQQGFLCFAGTSAHCSKHRALHMGLA